MSAVCLARIRPLETAGVNLPHRAQYALNWNLRLSRDVRAPLNLLNNGKKIVESDLSGPISISGRRWRFRRPGLSLGLKWTFYKMVPASTPSPDCCLLPYRSFGRQALRWYHQL